MKIAKCKIFEYDSRIRLEDEINNFIKTKTVISISLGVQKHGYRDYYTAIVLYEVEMG